MANLSWLNTGTLITLNDGSQKAIEEIAVGDEIQTYDASGEDFDCAHIEINEQSSGAVMEVEENSIESVDVSKISFSNDTNLILSSDSPIHGMKEGTNWVVASKDAADELYGPGIPDEGEPESRFSELSANDPVFVDDGDGLSYDVLVTEIESQEGKDDFTMYCISGMAKGHTVFANGVLLGLGVD